jgi:hypothetical protein
MVNSKRKIVDVVAEDDTSSLYPPNAPSPQRDIAISQANKKAKLTHVRSSESKQKGPRSNSAGTSATADSRSETHRNSNNALTAAPVMKEDENNERDDTFMEDVPEDEVGAQPIAPTAPVAPTTSPSASINSIANPPPVARADDLPSNPYAPPATEVGARAAYLREVGLRNLNLTRTPLQTPTSKVKQNVREVLYDRMFNQWTLEQCRIAVVARGGKAGGEQAVCKPILKYAPVWFAEENVVLPWVGRGKNDKDRLMALGLRPEHFPLLGPVVTPAAPPAPVPKQAKTKPAAKPPVPQRSVQQKSAQKHALSQPAPEVQPQEIKEEPSEQQVLIGEGREGRYEHSHHEQNEDLDMEDPEPIFEDELAAEMEAELQKTADAEERERERERERARAEKEKEAKMQQEAAAALEAELQKIAYEEKREKGINKIILPGLMDDRVRTALNIFGKDLTSLNSRSGGKAVTLSRSALLEHCGAARKIETEKMDYASASPQIMRAFANAISPFPRNGLPTHDFDFREDELDQGVNSPDVLGVMDADEVPVTKIDWTIDSLMVIYKLSVSFECTIVKDMVVDKLRELYQTYMHEAHLHEDTVVGFSPSIETINNLTLENDGPLLRLLVDIMISQNVIFGIPYLDDMANHVIELLSSRQSHPIPPMHIHWNLKVCTAYHFHSTQKLCYKTQTFINKTDSNTSILIDSFFAQIAEDAAELGSSIYDSVKAEEEEKAGRRRSKYAGEHGKQITRNDLVVESQLREKEVTHALYKLEMVARIKEKTGKPFDEKRERPVREKLYKMTMRTRRDYQKEWDMNYKYGCLP